MDLNFESNRLKTFTNWMKTYINVDELAMFGFYYCGPNDLVQCVFCNVEIGLWEEGDNVLNDHLVWSPSCKLLRGSCTQNVPLNPQRIAASLSQITLHTEARKKNTVSEGVIERICKEDIEMWQHKSYQKFGLYEISNPEKYLSKSLNNKSDTYQKIFKLFKQVTTFLLKTFKLL